MVDTNYMEYEAKGLCRDSLPDETKDIDVVSNSQNIHRVENNFKNFNLETSLQLWKQSS